MVYNEKLIVVIKSKGKILREFTNNEIFIPFGSDYSILIKNKDITRKAILNIKVDGKDVLDGNSLVVNSDSDVELEGFLKNDIVKNKFRFIEKTEEIYNFRGDFLEDGLIEVNYKFEQRTYKSNFRNKRNINVMGDYCHPDLTCSINEPNIGYCCNTNYSEEGITVPGEKTSQSFVYSNVGPLEDITHNIVIKLKGKHNSGKRNKKRIKKPVTTKSKIQCQTCGRRWRSNLNFCGNCGSYLT